MILVSGADDEDAICVAFALHAGGLKMLGEPAPTSLSDCLRAESAPWRDPVNGGIYFETNPHQGRYLHPEPTRAWGAVMDPLGVSKSDPAYIDRVVVVVRPWQHHRAPELWLQAIYEQLADSTLRRYPTWFVTREAISANPGTAAEEIARFLSPSAGIDAEQVESVFARLPPTSGEGVTSEHAPTMSELYAVLHARAELSDELVSRLNETLAGGA